MTDTDEVFDVIVIGAGPVGEIAAARAVRGGLTAAIVEERLAGGECAYYACVPSKALLRPVDLAAEVSRMPGPELRGPIDTAAVLARRDEAVSHLDDGGQVSWIENLPATFVRGRGRLARPLRVEATTPDGGTRALRARHAVVVATGSDPAIPDVPGLREARPWTNREATAVQQVPKRLVVIGGGPVGCEMSQALHALGAEETTMLVRDDRLLTRTEPFAGELLTTSFRASGIDVRLGRSPIRVERPLPDGPVTVQTDDGSRVEADEILVGAGRRVAVGDLGLETVGLTADGPIEVDASTRATGIADGWLYAVGDVNGRNLLTHMGKYQARVCGDVIAARAGGQPDDRPRLRDIADDRATPQVIFTDPQVCAVGRTESRARADGFAVRTADYDMGAVEGAQLQATGYTGRAKLVVDEDRRVVLGATFVAPGVVDLLHSATIAVAAEVPLDQLWHAVPSFPTVSEIWLELLEAYGL
ncbi:MULTISPECIES: NAD(P)/FAD-dependent oxidoreductase [unclassified Pseudofrankia]|uniref:dihydrolipoyl dehydrogenase family protein n=1 Tax=unclassified Pseudofrankia TaxID=2994372 RepID=UPI0008D96AB6|nr:MULTISPECIES: NAD(P)/FAD-dependent oxidoreductase [unclassified Pseudofrankia]MDT3441994.1 NAD(P)/FAD-dependent oxidoreductase [Pseudofrankia sp. BMG5.37]OHV44616.1 pyridine nucleotide-disulfide oxidoreductase [Pseudofrankia sp. BMG5.36]